MSAALADLAERLLRERLDGKLRPGERVTIQTTEVCTVCARVDYGDLDGGPCPHCDGRAWVHRVVTLNG